MFINRLTILLLCLALLLTITTPGTAASQPARSPEIAVTHPPQAGDGTAFLCTAKGEGLRSASFTFLGRTVEANAGSPASPTPEIAVLLPVPLDHPQGSPILEWTARLADGSIVKGSSPVRIVTRAYPRQKLTVAPKYVTPDPALKQRIDKEREIMGAALTVRTPVRHWELPMARPVPGIITSLYGLRRVFNEQPRNPHKGLDFRASQGDPITAVDDGTVVLTGDFYYTGKFVVIDHGLGVVSISMHMSEILSEKDTFVKRGDVIGLVGSTGRSTGPHLHLGISVLGQSIDALPLIAQTEADKKAYTEAVKKSSAKTGSKAATKKKSSPSAKSGAASGGKAAKKPGSVKTGAVGQTQENQ